MFSAFWWDLDTPTAGGPNALPALDRLVRVTGCPPRLLAIAHLVSGGWSLLAFDHDGALRWSRDVPSPDAVRVDAQCSEWGQIGVAGDTLDLATGSAVEPPTEEQIEARRITR